MENIYHKNKVINEIETLIKENKIIVENFEKYKNNIDSFEILKSTKEKSIIYYFCEVTRYGFLKKVLAVEINK